MLILGACGSGGGGDDETGPSTNGNKIPAGLFGANLAWERLGDGAMDYGDMLRDRSFRAKGDSTLADPWIAYTNNSGTATWNTSDPGDETPAGGKAYTGYVELSASAAGYTGIMQQLISGVSKNVPYRVH